MKKSLLIGTVVLGCLWARAGEIALTNPSFEKGTGGYWISKPALASIDSTDSSNGKQSLCIAGDSENRVDVVFFVAHEPEMVYELTFDVKGEGKADGPPVRVALMLQGQKPIAFWQPKGEEAKPFEPFSPAVD